MDFPKKQAQRLMPLYLLEYSEKLFTNHPDPSAPWGGGGGSDYTAGQGITITNNEISVDTNVVATKSDIAQMVTTTQLNDALDDYALKTEIPTDVSQLYNDAGYATETWVQNQGFISNIDLSNYPEIVDVTNGFPDETKTAEILANPSKYILHGTTTDGNGKYHIFGSYAGYIAANGDTWMQIIRIPAGSGYTGYTLRPYAFCYNTGGEWKGPLGFLWKISYGNIYNTPTLATVATSGSYNDLSDKPYIFPSNRIVDTDSKQNITGIKTFEGLIKVKDITHVCEISILPDIFDYTVTDPVTNEKSRTKFKLPTSKPKGTADAPTEYTFAMTDDIPTVNNPTITFTQGGTTKGTITLNQSGDQTIEFDAGASLPDSPFLKVEDPQDQMFFSLDGSDYSWSKYVDLSAAHNRMFYVNLSALNPVFKDGLTSTYNEQTNQLEVSLNAVIPSTATSTSTSTVTPTTGTFVTGTSTNTADVVNSVTYTPSSETLTFTYADNTTASFTFLTSSTTVTSGTTSVVTSVTDSTSNAMTGATVSTSTTTTLS